MHGEGQVMTLLTRDAEGHAATVGELEGVGQQVAQDLFGALAVGEQHLWKLALLLDLETQATLASQWREHIAQAFQHARQRRALGAHLELAGLDLGDVEDVVDQVEQIVTGRIDRLGELDLFIVEVAGGVLRQQLGQDERAVQRRAQLMAHVGEELGLVATGALQFLGTLFQLRLDAAQGGVALVQFVTLVGQGLRLLGKLLVGLFQLGLLRLQVGLGLLEHPRLLFELLVGGAQLFLLGLQLLVELLGMAEHLLQALTVARGLQSHTDAAGNGFEELPLTRLERAHEGQLDHAVDTVFGLQRYQGNADWLPLAET